MKSFLTTQTDQKATILWIIAGLGCDDESVAITAATQPSLGRLRLETMHRQARLPGAGRPMQCRQTRLDERHRRLPERRRHLRRLYDARFSRQIYVVYESAAGLPAAGTGRHDLRQGDPRAAALRAGGLAQPGTGVATAQRGADERLLIGKQP